MKLIKLRSPRAVKIGFCLSLTVLIVACGGGTDGNAQNASQASTAETQDTKILGVPSGWLGRKPTVEKINGIIVPPEPDEIQNNSSVTGIDANANGIRDDVERVIAREFGSNENKYKEAFSFAKIEQTMIVSPSEENIKAYSKSVDCTSLVAKETNILTHKLLNNSSRKNIYGLSLAGSLSQECSSY